MPTLLKRSNGYYYAIFSDGHGHRRWVSTGRRIRSQALKVFSERSSPPQLQVRGKTIQVFFQEFMDYGGSIYASENLQIYRRAFGAFVRHVGTLNVNSVSQKHVDVFKSKRLKEVSRITVNIELRTLRAAFYLALRWKLISDNPFRQVQLCAIEESVPAFLTTKDL